MKKSYYVLKNGTPTPEPDVFAWARFMVNENVKKIIKKHRLGNIFISTVFLGIDHSIFDDGPPVLWETMIFNGRYNGYQKRYCSRAEALLGHYRAVGIALVGILLGAKPNKEM